MRFSFVLLALLPLLTACTADPHGSELHMPLSSATWEKTYYNDNNGKKVCAVTSGRNGLTILVRKKSGNDTGVAVKMERRLIPGTLFKVNVNDNYYRTTQEYFSSAHAVALVNDLVEGDKAYLEWVEPDGNQRGMQRFTNILSLHGVKSLFEQCRKSAG